MTQTSVLDKAPQATPALLGIGTFFLMMLAGSALLNDPDTYWHIATGRWILENGAIPNTDPFSHTMTGADWHAHEWAAAMMLAGAHSLAGWTGVVLAAAFAFSLTLGLFAWGLSTYLRPLYVVILVAIAFVGISHHLVARPHVLVMPVLMLWLVLLVFARSRGTRPPLAAALLMIPWANMHGSFPIGLALGGVLALEALLDQSDREARLKVIRDWGLFMALATAAAFVTPYGLQGFLFPFHIGGMDKSFKWIMEWHPPNFREFPPVEIWLMVVLGTVFVRGLRVPVLRLLVCLGLLHLALSHVRMAEYLIFIASLLLAPVIAAQWRDAPRDPDPAPLSAGTWARLRIAACGLLTAGLAVLIVTDIAPSDRKSPVAALAAARQVGLTDRPVFNEYNFGGYLIYEGVPTFIDGRADMYGDAFLDRTLTAATDPLASPTLSALLKEHGIGWTLLAVNDVSARLLDKDPAWQEIYRDHIAVIHVPATGRETLADIRKPTDFPGSVQQ